MNTTAAATQAGVTIPTIRTWCRRGVIAAAKQAGRWVIDQASLAARIAIGKLKKGAATVTDEELSADCAAKAQEAEEQMARYAAPAKRGTEHHRWRRSPRRPVWEMYMSARRAWLDASHWYLSDDEATRWAADGRRQEAIERQQEAEALAAELED